MSGIKVVLHLVSCASNLLICDDLDTTQLVFQSSADCEKQRAEIIEVAQRHLGSSAVIMGRCRFQVSGATPTEPRVHAAPASAALANLDPLRSPATPSLVVPPTAPPSGQIAHRTDE
jgi:hypothetical protein